MSLSTPARIQKLQRKLYLKAKQNPSYRFYALYDKVYREDILFYAYNLVKANRGVPGVDGIDFKDIESYGKERFLTELQRELQERRYRPEAVLRVMIPKPTGGERPLGIPTIKDRVVQTAAKLILEPIFEADLPDNAYGYRPKRSATQAVQEVHKQLKSGCHHVVDADLSKYFDTIPHAELLCSVSRRVVDGTMLHLLKMWLKSPVEETNGKEKRCRKRAGNCGTPQGGVISPLLANIYMRRFLRAWKLRGNDKKYGSRIVSYADDFVILCQHSPQEALAAARKILSRIGLVLNENKTRICYVWRESFDFLGYSFGVQYLFGSGRPYLAAYPSKEGMRRVKQKLRNMTDSRMTWQNAEKVVVDVNRVLRGWTNYFSYGSLWKKYHELERFMQQRLRGWLVRKHKVYGRGECKFPPAYIYDELGLLHPTRMLASKCKV